MDLRPSIFGRMMIVRLPADAVVFRALVAAEPVVNVSQGMPL